MAPNLSKSRFQHGLQCLKRLYLESYRRELADPVEPGQQAILDTGTAVGELARGRFPGGLLVDESHLEHDQSVDTTRELLEATDISVLYEAGFSFQEIRTRVDILTRAENKRFDLIEVKSTTRVKPEHYTDVAIQLYVVEGSGIPIDRTFLMHLNRDYEYQGGEYDLEELFTLTDVTAPARSFVKSAAARELTAMWSTLQLESEPEIPTGPHCNKPYRCSFYGYCHRELPVDSGTHFVSPDLGMALEGIRLPAAFLDFETVNPAIPVYEGTRPYEVIPFQWSLHTLDSRGHVDHRWFLNDDGDDPRERLASSLLETVPAEGSIVTYSPYERTVVNGLARALPMHADRLLALVGRMVDLLRIVRTTVRHPGFHGSYSLKSVLPVLVPGMGYSALEIHDGMAAAMSYMRMIDSNTPECARTEIHNALLSYCQRDTEGMLRVYEALTFGSMR